MRKRFVLLLIVGLFSRDGYAQPKEAPPPPAPAPVKPAPGPSGTTTEPAYLKISIDPSRSPISMDTEAALSAEIKNVSSVAVRLFENETVFLTMPEARIYTGGQPGIQSCATFPTQGNPRSTKRPDRGYELLLQPGDSYRVFWDTATNGCTGERYKKLRIWNDTVSWFEEKWQRIAFTPGTYKVYMDVVVYPESQAPYRTTTDGRDIQLSASLQMVLLGSFLGGLLAYLIKLYYGVETELKVKLENSRLRRILGRTEWLAAGLFGGAMVILASRLSDTFPVKVSANDFWGSVTLGFIFQWIGVKLLEKLPGMSTVKSPPAQPQGPKGQPVTP